MITFEEARRIVESTGPVRTAAQYGYQSDAYWFPVIAPERVGGRVPGVRKSTGVVVWMSAVSDEYASADLFGSPP